MLLQTASYLFFFHINFISYDSGRLLFYENMVLAFFRKQAQLFQ